MTTGSFYHFFAGKEELLLAVLDREAETSAQMLAEAEAASEIPLQRILRLFEFHRGNLVAEGLDLGSILSVVTTEIGNCSSRVRAGALRIQALYLRTLESWIEDAAGVGINQDSLSFLVHALLEGTLLQARLMGDLSPFDRVIPQLDLLLSTPLRKVDGEDGGEDLRRSSGVEEEEETNWRSW